MKDLLTCGMLLLVTALAAQTATLTIPAAVTAHGSQVMLSEIATITGTDEEQTRLKTVVLGASPVIGQSRELTPAMIRVRLRQYGIAPDNVTIESPATIQVTRASTAMQGDSLVAVAQAWLQAKLTPAAGEELVLAPVRVPTDLQLPDGTIDWECSAAGDGAGGVQHVLVTVLANGQASWRGIVSFKVQRFMTVLVAKTLLVKGAALSETLISVERRDVTALNGLPLRDPHDVLGTRAAQSLVAGAVLTTQSTEPIPLVKRNDEVHVRAVCGAFVISTLATALEDGIAGATIRVRNPQTRQEYAARVISAGELELVQ